MRLLRRGEPRSVLAMTVNRMEIIQNVHLIPNVIANPYLMIDSDGLTLIDAGIPGSEKKILKYIDSLGFAPADLKHILITHADYDHVGGLAALKNVCRARIYASKAEAEAIRVGRSSRQLKPEKLMLKMMYALANRYAKTTPVEVDHFLTGGQIFDEVLGGLLVVDTPGHTPGHISFFAPNAGILFAGDSMVSDDRGLYRSVIDNTWDHTQAVESVRKQVDLGASIVCTGHGPVVRDASNKYPQV
jgi:glyoxylase-like metal-dependent hydrolase (beta-lactamase superfamily II)